MVSRKSTSRGNIEVINVDVVFVLFLIVGLLVLLDLAAIVFGSDSRDSFVDPRIQPAPSVR
jgi:hypothetical protein